MFWLLTLRAVANNSGFYVDPKGNVWSHWYRGSKGNMRATPHRMTITTTIHGYSLVNLRGKTRLVHTLVAKAFLSLTDDHVNRDRGDNSLDNLRACSRSENNRNVTRARGGSSRYLGVSLERRTGRYVGALMANRVTYGGKSFRSQEAAALYRDSLAREHHGEFCSLNFPDVDSNLYPLIELFSKVNA
jgi:hypothetical protein